MRPDLFNELSSPFGAALLGIGESTRWFKTRTCMGLWQQNEARRLDLYEAQGAEPFPCGWDERDAKV